MTTTQRLKDKFPDLGFVKPMPVESHPRYTPFKVQFSPNSNVTLQKGHEKEAGKRQMQVETLLHRDTAIPLRDGCHVYADIYRPASSESVPVPAVICWSPYGKSSINLNISWYRSGVPQNWTSGYETFEGLDPADWCKRGYAVVNVDSRGSQFSEGTFFFWGDQEAEDIYDTIDYLAKQSWCNQSVAMGGNSYLAKAQLCFASRLSHPALKALAPWEGFTDIYRQLFRRGGLAMNNKFGRMFQWGVAGQHEVEDMATMIQTHPFFDAYWTSKDDSVDKITVPLYLLGSFGNPFHTYASFDTYRRARSEKKWLRVHATFEWYEMYERRSNDDLQRFLDRYCKGIMNGWEHDTPPVRLSLHGFGTLPNITERPEHQFPLQRQELRMLYLDASNKALRTSAPEKESSICHRGHGAGHSSDFVFTVDEYTEICGYSKVKLFMSCREHDDMDVVVQLRKIDSSGNLLASIHFTTHMPDADAPEQETAKLYGPQGFLRASARGTRDSARSSADGQEVFYRHDSEEKIPPGTIVPLEITFWPIGMILGPGEGIMLRVSGHFLSGPVVEAMRQDEFDDENKGDHYIHTGGEHSSQLTIPIISRGRA